MTVSPLNDASLVLWQDDSLLVVNKPSGLATLPEGWDREAPHLKATLEPVFGRLWVVHRLDKETSGVLVLARSAEAHRDLNRQFEGRAVEKVYHALVAGEPAWETRQVGLALRPNSDRKHRTTIDPRAGKQALTALRVLARLRGATLLEAVPHTGRTHQIRAHLAALRHPILGDNLYGDWPAQGLRREDFPPSLPWPSRLLLHARSLTISHPVRHEHLHFEAPYPPDFQEILIGLTRG